MRKYDLTLTQVEGQTDKEVCAIKMSYPKVGPNIKAVSWIL